MLRGAVSNFVIDCRVLTHLTGSHRSDLKTNRSVTPCARARACCLEPNSLGFEHRVASSLCSSRSFHSSCPKQASRRPTHQTQFFWIWAYLISVQNTGKKADSVNWRKPTGCSHSFNINLNPRTCFFLHYLRCDKTVSWRCLAWYQRVIVKEHQSTRRPSNNHGSEQIGRRLSSTSRICSTMFHLYGRWQECSRSETNVEEHLKG